MGNIYDELPRIEGFDFEEAISKMYFANVLKMSLMKFMDASPVYKENLEKYYATIEEAESMDAYRIEAHSIKGLMLTLGNKEFSEFAKEMEFAARDNDLGKIFDKHADFIAELDRVTESLKVIK